MLRLPIVVEWAILNTEALQTATCFGVHAVQPNMALASIYITEPYKRGHAADYLTGYRVNVSHAEEHCRFHSFWIFNSMVF